jgi:hypothetical protein
MLSIRIVTTRAALAAAVVVAGVVGAAAQTAQPAATPGKPIQLLQIVERSDKTTKTKSHVKTVAKTVAKTHHKHVATKAHHGPLPANGPAITTVAAVPATDPSAEPALAFAEPMTNVVTVAGQSVQVAEPDDVNDIDRTADTLDKLARKNVAAADAAVAPAPEAPASSALIVTSTSTSAPQGKSSTSGNASWLAEALAALGGAIAAASAAWFLIGSTPQRLYG